MLKGFSTSNESNEVLLFGLVEHEILWIELTLHLLGRYSKIILRDSNNLYIGVRIWDIMGISWLPGIQVFINSQDSLVIFFKLHHSYDRIISS